MRERRRFQAGLEVVNRSATAIDPDLSSVILSVDGSRSAVWDRAVEGVPNDAPWRKLPPKQRLSIWWSLGEHMFEGPGRYQLVLKLGDRESVAEVEITP